MSAPALPRPGLAKARARAAVRSRAIVLHEASDAGWRIAIDTADVVSEGRAETEPGGVVYYGSTSVLLPFVGASAPPSPAEIAALALIAPLDPHLRVRALRIARREAALRSGGELDSVHAELTVVVDASGVRVTIDVVAPVVARLSGTHA